MQITFLKIKQANMKQLKITAILVAGILLSTASFAQGKMKERTVEVGGAPMYPSKNIVENAVNSKDHTTLVAAVKAADLVSTLQGPGPFTVFAPTNKAFNLLPAGTVDNLVKPENKGTLTKILTYHVVPGRLDSKDLKAQIKRGNGTAVLTTVQGEKLYVMRKGNQFMVKDEKGNVANITIKDVYQSNGVIHVIDHVLMPK